MSDATNHDGSSPFPPEIAQGGVVLTLTPDQLYVEFAELLSPAEIARLLTEQRLAVVEHRTVQEELAQRDRPRADDAEDAQLAHALWLRSVAGDDTTRLIMTLRADSRVSIASPVYHRANLRPADSGLSFTDQLLVRVGPTADDAQVDALLRSLGAKVVSVVPNERYGAIYQVRVPLDRTLFEVARGVEQSPLVTYAGVDWRQLSSPSCGWTPDDSHFPQQWHLERIQAPRGWELTAGTRNVTIAIIDSGCDIAHPDLVTKLVPLADRFDSLTGSNNMLDVEGHGTCCAGIAAAATDNAAGVAGTAPRCMIMPIRLRHG